MFLYTTQERGIQGCESDVLRMGTEKETSESKSELGGITDPLWIDVLNTFQCSQRDGNCVVSSSETRACCAAAQGNLALHIPLPLLWAQGYSVRDHIQQEFLFVCFW